MHETEERVAPTAHAVAEAPEIAEDTWIAEVVGVTLRRLRLTRNLGQGAIARRCGVSHQQIHKYETGKSDISVVRLFQLAAVLDMTPSRLVQEIEYVLPEYRAERIDKPRRQTYHLVEFYERIDDEAIRGKVLGLVRNIAKRWPKRADADEAESVTANGNGDGSDVVVDG